MSHEAEKDVAAILDTDLPGRAMRQAVREAIRRHKLLGQPIRCPGRDDRFETDAYTLGTFLEKEFDRDIVWADGFVDPAARAMILAAG